MNTPLDLDRRLFEPPPGDPPAAIRHPAPPLRAWLLPGLLFAATLVSTTLVGLIYAGYGEGGFFTSIRAVAEHPSILVSGLPFSLTFVGILLVHELGHFFACRYYGIRCTPPFFIPLPVSIAGTLGAFIKIQSPFQDKRALFDVGVAGPLAGFAALLPALAIGLRNSQLIPRAATPDGAVMFGEPLLFRWGAELSLGYVPSQHDIVAHPMAMAAWFGLLATCLNLLPIWQLDGGHVAYAVIGRTAQRRLSAAGALALIAVSFLGWPIPSYLVFGMLLLVLGSRFRFYHPPTLADDKEIGPGRRAVAIVALAILIVSFTPVPFAVH